MSTMSEKPGTPSSEQSDKAKKYDRQLRLWGDHGQSALESSHICLINSSGTGTEILKSLVLPGVGAITIVDNTKITLQDLGNNFFLDYDSVGSYRGEIALQNLRELNTDVCGTFVDQPVEEILANQPEFFNNFTVVIATNIRESSLVQLSQLLWNAKIPLLVARSYGLIGYVRLQVEEHPIIESHPDNEIPDLRLDRPFASLLKYTNSVDLDSLTHQEYSHTPYAIILLKYLDVWKAEHQGEIPRNYKEKKEFCKLLRTGMKSDEESEENFEEAIKAVNPCIVKASIPSDVSLILEEANEMCLSPSTSSFWIMVKAMQQFMSNEGQGLLPLSGVIPDMTADSEKYIKLQTLYREQANHDSDCVYKYVQDIVQQLGPKKGAISEFDVRLFCKNAHHIRIIKGRSIAEEYRGAINLGDLGCHLEDPRNEIVWYVLLRAVDQFYSEFRAYPGFFKDQVETDIVRLKACINKLLSEWGVSPCIKDEFIHEICRYGASEIHTIAAFVGGIAAQEVIKICTKQFVPIKTAVIYNAIDYTVETLNL